VVVAQSLGADDAVEVGLHELLHEVDVPEGREAGRLEDVEDGDDVFVAKVAEELDLAEGAETEHGVVEGGDALYRDPALGGLVHGRAAGGQRGSHSESGLTRRCHTRPRR
jgi:hypothetical protein